MKNEKNCQVFAFSPTGTTARVAQAISRGLQAQFHDVTVQACPARLQKGQLAVLVVPSFGGRVPAVALERFAQITGEEALAAVVTVYGNRKYEDTLVELADVMGEQGFTTIAGAAFVARHSVIPAIASGRPNREDLSQARDFGTALAQKLEQGMLQPVQLPGNRPYRKFGGMAFKPAANENCNGCGLCAANCPVGAISKEQPALTDPDKCITCMRCVYLCPQQARSLSDEAQDAMAAKLCRVCSQEQHNELFL